MQRRIPDFPDSFHSWNFLSSIGSGITFLSFAIFFLYLFMRSFLIIILLFLNGIGFQSIIGATTVCYFLNLWNYKRRWMLRPLGRNCRRTLSLIQHHSLEIYTKNEMLMRDFDEQWPHIQLLEASISLLYFWWNIKTQPLFNHFLSF